MQKATYNVLVITRAQDRIPPYHKTFKRLSTDISHKDVQLREYLIKEFLADDFDVEMRSVSIQEEIDSYVKTGKFDAVVIQGAGLFEVAEALKNKRLLVCAYTAAKSAVAEYKRLGVKAWLISDVNEGLDDRTLEGFCAEVLREMFKRL
jgi:hypothetical protein